MYSWLYIEAAIYRYIAIHTGSYICIRALKKSICMAIELVQVHIQQFVLG